VLSTARRTALLIVLVLAGCAVRLLVLGVNDELSADEALPGLIALHIASGAERPVFYYGQHYFGAVEAYLVAGLFKAFGFHPWLTLVPAFAASLALIPMTYALAAIVAGDLAGALAVLPLVVPPPIFARLLVNGGGGFSLAFALHAAALLCCIQALRHARHAVAWGAAFSAIAGILCWIWQPAVPLYGALLLALVAGQPAIRRWWALPVVVLPVLAGAAPPLLYNATRGWPTIAQLAGKYTTPAGEATSGPGSGPVALLEFLWLAFGGGNEAEGGANVFQAAVVAVFGTVGLLFVGGTSAERGRRRGMLLLALAFVVDVAAAHATVRHLVPAALVAYVFMGVGLALAARRLPLGRAAAVAAAVLVLVPNAWLDFHAGEVFRHFVPRASASAAVARALLERGLVTGYSDYWSAYPVTYFAGERVVLAPRVATLWGGRVDRYPAYTARVDGETDIRRLFLLLDDRCALLPYIVPLEDAGAAYRAEHVAQWVLVWDVRAPEGQEEALLARWRSAIDAQDPC
jgi:hypothetical protein